MSIIGNLTPLSGTQSQRPDIVLRDPCEGVDHPLVDRAIDLAIEIKFAPPAVRGMPRPDTQDRLGSLCADIKKLRRLIYEKGGKPKVRKGEAHLFVVHPAFAKDDRSKTNKQWCRDENGTFTKCSSDDLRGYIWLAG